MAGLAVEASAPSEIDAVAAEVQIPGEEVVVVVAGDMRCCLGVWDQSVLFQVEAVAVVVPRFLYTVQHQHH